MSSVQLEKQFLCCFCGIIIKKNKNNLDRHERLHANKINKHKCSAKQCGSTFVNKGNYYVHWRQQHNNTVMPDCLNLIYDDPMMKKRSIKTAESRKQNFNEPIDYEILQSVGLIRKVSVKIENNISEFLKSNPHFGELQ